MICPVTITISPLDNPSKISTLSPKILPAVTFLSFAVPFSITKISLLLTLPTNAFLGTIFKVCFCWFEANFAVPYIPAFKSFEVLFVISISTGKFKLASAFGAIKVIFPVNSLSGYTFEPILITLPTFKLAT